MNAARQGQASVTPNIPRSSAKLILATAIALPSIAISTTFVRLYVRKPRNWKVDDFLASLATSTLIIQEGLYWQRYRREILQVAPIIISNFPPSYYVQYLCFFVTIWLARTSLLFSIIRITPDENARKRRKWIAVFFGILAFFHILEVICACTPHNNVVTGLSSCLAKQHLIVLPLYHLISGIVADSILVFLPLWTLQSLKSSPGLRWRLSLIFMCSLVTSAFSIATGAVILGHNTVAQHVLSFVEGSVAIIVCNMPVFATAFYRAYVSFHRRFRPDVDPTPIQFADMDSHGTLLTKTSRDDSLDVQDFPIKSLPSAITGSLPARFELSGARATQSC